MRSSDEEAVVWVAWRSIDEKAPAPRLQRERPTLPIPPSSAPASAQRWSPYSFTPDTARSYHYYPASSASAPASSLRSPAGPGRQSTPSSRRADSPYTTLRAWLPLIMTELFEFLDDLSLYLRADEQYGHAVLFVLIFPHHHPPLPALLHPHRSIRVHFRRMDRRHHLLLRCPARRHPRLPRLPAPPARAHRAMAAPLPHHQARRPRHRQAPQAPFPHPPRPLPLQRHELPPRRVSHPLPPHLHRLHRALPLQGHHPHQHRRVDTLLLRLAPAFRRRRGRLGVLSEPDIHGYGDPAVRPDPGIPLHRRAARGRRRAGRRTCHIEGQ
ncbi:unnamed protein product [Cyclocybe aegerita]|uniref:Uncharacterized protein n=1 Tax=Cyclocybe aegerita TaxID=1973307 RepID=A0A8S0XE44_CYCAE|nr:unnamed protein product [Cyclocybe aegerita]